MKVVIERKMGACRKSPFVAPFIDGIIADFEGQILENARIAMSDTKVIGIDSLEQQVFRNIENTVNDLRRADRRGRTVIEKIEEHGDVGFASVLLTPDDVGAQKDNASALRPRARQNVLLELGYFIGRLERSRVVALRRGDVEVPSDLDGVVYVTFDSGNGWKQDLGKELQAVGYELDWNQIMGRR